MVPSENLLHPPSPVLWTGILSLQFYFYNLFQRKLLLLNILIRKETSVPGPCPVVYLGRDDVVSVRKGAEHCVERVVVPGMV